MHVLLFETNPKRSVLIFKEFYLKTLGNNLPSSQFTNCATFSLPEKPTEKKRLKDEKTKGNKGMKISANSNENANVRVFSWDWKRELCFCLNMCK